MQLDLLEVKRMPADTRQADRRHSPPGNMELHVRACRRPIDVICAEGSVPPGSWSPCRRQRTGPAAELQRFQNQHLRDAKTGLVAWRCVARRRCPTWQNPGTGPCRSTKCDGTATGPTTTPAVRLLCCWGLDWSFRHPQGMPTIRSHPPPPCPGLLATPEVLHRGSVLRYNDLDSLVLEQTYRYFSAGARASCTAAVLHGVPCYD